MNLERIAPQDIPELAEMARAAHKESKYNHLPFSERSVQKTFEEHIAAGFAVKVMAEKIAGFFLGTEGSFVFSETPISVETTYYVRPEYRGTRCFFLMIKSFIDWHDRPLLLMPHFSHDNSKTYSALEKMGFLDAGKIYTRSI